VLVATRQNHRTPLLNAHFLAEYDTILLEPTWTTLTGVESGVPAPGGTARMDQKWVVLVGRSLHERHTQLEAFFRAGGVLVVLGNLPSAVYWSYDHLDSHAEDLTETHRWWSDYAGPIGDLHRRRADGFLLGSGTGPLDIHEPGHFLESLIEPASYSVRMPAREHLTPEITVLATNRVGDPVAVEIPVHRGRILILPSGVDQIKVMAAVHSVQQSVAEVVDGWKLPDETEVERARDERLHALRVERDAAEKALSAIRIIKQAAVSDIDAQRVLKYYRAGTDQSRAIKRQMTDLYTMVEILEGWCGGGEKDVETQLGVSVKRIKKVANQPQYDYRHATTGPPVGADVALIDAARQDATSLVQAFLDVLYAREKARRDASK